jgi:prepilin-type N-terminal cleavage/methylation domain-containing protein
MSNRHVHSHGGFTLIELMCALAVMLVLLESSLSFSRQLLPHLRLVSDTNQVVGLLAQARSHALGQGPVLVCAAGSDCTRFPSSDGLLLVIDANHNDQFDAGETVLAHLQLHRDTHLSWHSFRNLPHLAYRRNGLAYFQNGHLLLCTDQEASKVVVNWIGRPYAAKVDDLSVCNT